MTRKLLREIYDLAWPVLIAQLAVMAYAVVDTLMTGRYATDDLAAVGIGASIYFSVFVGLMGILLAVTPTVAQLLGAQRFDEIGEQVRQAMWLVLVLTALSVVVFRYPDPLLRLSDRRPQWSRRSGRTSPSRPGGRRPASRSACSRATPRRCRYRG